MATDTISQKESAAIKIRTALAIGKSFHTANAKTTKPMLPEVAPRASNAAAQRPRVALQNSMGDAWTADYLKITGELDVDLRSNIAAEARAKIVYERLIQFTEDSGTIRALQFLMTREITHMKAFTAALEGMGKNRFSIGSIPPTPELVNQYFDDSTGTGDRGEPNARGPWNTGGDWEIVEAPAFKELKSEQKGTRLPSNGGNVKTVKAGSAK